MEEYKRGGKERWRIKAIYLRLMYCGVLSLNDLKAMHWAELSPNYHCRGCGKYVDYIDADVLPGYWRPVWYIVHKQCRVTAKANEALCCQTIDADCNDCKHFQRGVNVKENYWRDFPGWCLKLNKETHASPLYCTRYICFEHRKVLNEITKSIQKEENRIRTI
jgi:hypothetical protein